MTFFLAVKLNSAVINKKPIIFRIYSEIDWIHKPYIDNRPHKCITMEVFRLQFIYYLARI